MGWEWVFALYRRRPIPAGARVHASVRTRITKDPQYADKIPADAMWDEEAWPEKPGIA
jgi:hypothetical protein